MSNVDFPCLSALAVATAVNVGLSATYPTSALIPAGSLGITLAAFTCYLGVSKMFSSAGEKTVAAAMLGISMLPLLVPIIIDPMNTMYWTTAFSLTIGIGIAAQSIKDTEFGKTKIVNDSVAGSIQQRIADSQGSQVSVGR